MKTRTIGLSLFIMLFTWVGIIEAASISTRVRILEGKVSQFDKRASTENSARQALEARLNEKLTTVDDLKFRVDKMSKQMEQRGSGKFEDNRYTFP